MRLITVTVLSVLLILTSCSGGDTKKETAENISTQDTRTGGTVIRHLESECNTLSWVLYTSVYENYVLRLLYDNLLDRDENLNIIPVLAKDYSISDDHMKITITLRDDIYWHDGLPITTADVVFTMDKILDPAVPALNKQGYFTKLDRLEVVDERTVVFHWTEPYAPSLQAITQFAPIPKHIYDTDDFLRNPYNRKPVGSGPFKFEEWRTSQMISVVRNDNYHNTPAYLDRIIFKIIPDGSVALNALKAGELDEMRVTQIQWERQTNDPGFMENFNKHLYYVPAYNYIGWNCRSIWFRDKLVRQAMSQLFDCESINAKLYSGYAKLVSGPFYINHWSYDKSIKPWAFDPQDAKRKLEQAGWIDHDGDGILDKDGIKFEFEFIIPSGGQTGKQYTQILQEECAKVGIVVKIRMLEGATFFEKVDKGEFDACALQWRLDIDPDIFDTFHSSQVPPMGLNHVFYSNPEVDKLLEQGRLEFDQDKRADIYHQIHRLMHEDQPYTFVVTVPEKRPINKRIQGVVISPDGPFNFYPGAAYWYVENNQTQAKR
jgi:peptide/nickel transport system substrate-binding protein